MTRAAAVAALLAACGCGRSDDGGREEPARRASFAGIRFDRRGVSQPVRVAVPERTRSIAVVVRGAEDVLYGLARFETADGIEHVRLPRAVDLGRVMRTQYLEEGIGLMPGELRQSIRLGAFTAIFPDRPGVALPAGEAVFEVAASDPASPPVDVDVLMPADDGARVLPVNVFAVSSRFAYAATDAVPFVPGLQAILGAAGIEVAVERVVSLPDSGLSRMSELSRPQEPPSSASSQLALLGGAMVPGDALNLFIVDELPGGVAGWTLGTPGPPLPDTCYSGVVASQAQGEELPRVLAHEIGHYLGLAHPVDPGRSGAAYPDPLDDTEPGQTNLMAGDGVALTRDQAYVLGRSPLLR